jgi:predicted ArsR family transcriptional regulator
MAGIPRSSSDLSPDAQRLLDYLRDHPNEQFTLEALAQALGSSADAVQIQLEALEYQGEIEKDHPEGGQAVYFRPQRT